LIKLRTIATAYLMNNEEFLLMKRSKDRKFKPGIWAGVGGHLEPHEINNPEEACLREIFEETGIDGKNLEGFKLKYIILRRSKEEIRIQYVYFAYSKTRNINQTDEGELFWINKKELFDRDLSATTKETLKHYINFEDSIEDILVGTVSAEDNRPLMNWVPVQDWEGML
jgi:8-oxo-dGTP diphosphatase